MGSPRITCQRVVQALRPLLDADVADVAAEEQAAIESGAVEAMIEQAEREWTAAERTEAARISRMFTDQPHARRARRRANRTVLRMLPDLLRPLDVPDDLMQTVNRTVRGLPVRCPNTGTDQCDSGLGCPVC